MRRVRILASLIGMIMLFSVLSAGVAFAHSDGAEDAFTNHAHLRPVARAVDPTGPGWANGVGPTGPGFKGITNNPLCPRHVIGHP